MDISAVINLGLIVVLSYLIGSIPTSIIVAKTTKGIDIRKHGSGNAGSTNVFRVLGWKSGLFVALFDVFKGFFAAYFISRLSVFGTYVDTIGLSQVVAGTAAVMGHCYTVFAKFKGGKGVATSAGMLIAIYPLSFVVCAVAFALVLFSTGIVSLSSITAAVVFPIALLVFNMIWPGSVSISFGIFSLFASAFIVYAHRSNIKRLLAGTENRFNNLRIFK